MTNEPENMNQNKPDEQGASPKPKKKNLIAVFRPQNSKTGMVKPDQRPGTGKKSGSGKPGQPGRSPQGAAPGRRAPGTRPAPQGERPAARTAQSVQRPAAERTKAEEIKRSEALKTPETKPKTAAKAAAPEAAPAAVKKTATAESVNSEVKAASSEAASAAAAAETKQAEAKHVPETRAAQETAPAARASEETKNDAAPGTAPAGRTEAAGKPAAGADHTQAPAGRTEIPQTPAARTENAHMSSDEGSTSARPHTSGQGTRPQQSQGTTRGQGQGTRLQQGQGFRGQGQGTRPQQGQGFRSQGQGTGRTPSGTGYNRGGERYQNGPRTQGQGGQRPFGSRDQSGTRTGMPGRNAGEGRYTRNDQNAGRSAGPGQRPFGASQGGRPSAVRGGMDPKPMEKEGRMKNERGKGADRKNGRPEKGDKFDRFEQRGAKGAVKNSAKNTGKGKFNKPAPQPQEEEKIKTITVPETLTIRELADLMKIQPAVIIKKLFLQDGKMVTVNDEIDFDTAEEIAFGFDVMCEKEVKVNVIEELLKDTEDPEESLKPRPPVVCVMGHVDHGKTSLLDAIRNTHITDREAGGITQHIGASVVECNGQKITFLDTPGHEAFTAMRMRGANSTDIAILVVAADDGVMPQTVEAISHAKAAGIEIIVAINKIDKPAANVERVKQELTKYDITPEDWGGSTVFCEVSAKTHEGIDNLLEMILLTAEVLELKANPDRRARGLVIEAQLDKGRGPVATVLVQKGVLHVGDPICAGSCYGKVRAMLDDKRRNVKEAGPSTPVEIIGFSGVPGAGEILVSPETEKEARSFADTFITENREKMIEETKSKVSLDDLFSQMKAGNLKELNLIVKADVQGSVEAVKQSLIKLSNDEVIVKVIHSGAGAINESDVILASASNAIIIGFNVKPDPVAKSTAEQEGVDVRLYSVIYDAINDVEAAMKGMLDPIFEEKVIGHAEIRQTFRASGVGVIAGSYVLDGILQRGCKARVSRDGQIIFDGPVASLKRFKDDVKEVKSGYECGIVFEKFNEIREGDQIEAYAMVEVPR